LPGDSGLEVIDNRNEQFLSALTDKSRGLLEFSRSVRRTLADDKTQLESLSTSMDTGSDLVTKGRATLSSITDDPTYFGFCKIATLVFCALVIVRLLLKLLYWLIRRK
jgi:hypothetical protein